MVGGEGFEPPTYSMTELDFDKKWLFEELLLKLEAGR